MPLVTVLLPVYNSEKYLGKSIDSVLDQTFNDFELIVVDDGSTDRSNAIVKAYMKRDSRIILIEQSNQGVVRSLNNALNVARGQFAARMDADDICLTDRLALQVAYLQQNHDAVIVGGHCYTIDEDGDAVGMIPVVLSHDEINASLLRERTFGDRTHIVHPAVMFRTQAALKIGGYREEFRWAEDRDFFLRLGEVGELANLNEFILYYRHHCESVSNTKAVIQQESAYKAIIEARKRRGLPPVSETEIRWTAAPAFSPLENSKNLAAAAANSGNFKTAQKHAMKVFIEKPISRIAWKVLLLSYLSPKVVNALRSLKNSIRISNW